MRRKGDLNCFDFLYPNGYRRLMGTFFRTGVFAKWLSGLKDVKDSHD